MRKKWYLYSLGLGLCLNCFAGSMGVVKSANRFYIEGMFDYNWFGFDKSYTASFFSPENIHAITASINHQWGYGIGAGYQVNDFFRMGVTFHGRPDVKYSVTDNAPETATGSFDNYTVMINGYLSPSISFMNFKPYVMGGIGIANNRTSSIFWPLADQIEYGSKTTPFAWQTGLGTLFAVGERFSIDFNYAFVYLGDITNSGQYNAIAANNTPAFGAPTKFTRAYANQLELGAHYQFSL